MFILQYVIQQWLIYLVMAQIWFIYIQGFPEQEKVCYILTSTGQINTDTSALYIVYNAHLY